MTEILQSIVLVFTKKAVTLICRQCGDHAAGVLNVPPDVTVLDKQSFVCASCMYANLYVPSKESRRRTGREELATLNAQINEPPELSNVQRVTAPTLMEVVLAE